ncbi:SLAM family member 6 [Pangasianodon hypophthalmus]|uniref:SLAM family member 6 n=1 Tax=Pangasianodon hypophthalmus TaxID=310915 RepID=UPI00230833D4|nr:SLAM family member 6 [Pangasianodon hypophthalmus]
MLLELAGVLHLIFLIHAQGSPFQKPWAVTCDDESICTLETSHVFIKCSYTHTNIHTVIWFSPKQKNKWKNENYPEDLALDSDFAGRVNHIETLNSSTLSIRDVRLGDSGEYRFMLVTANGEKYLSSIAVNLTVTDLQVRIHPGITEQVLNLTCSTHCRLTAKWNTWWKNGKRIKAHLNAEPLLLSAGDGGSYFCSLKTKNKVIHSPAVCVWEKNCWNVIYAQRRVCAFKGSSVNFPCTYSYPSGQKVNESYWMFNQNDVRLLEQFAGRVEFVGNKENNCTLRLTDLKESDSGDYRFLFTTDTTQPVFSSSLSIQLIVTDVQVRVRSANMSEGQTVTLSCITSCTLPYHTLSWYQNGQRVMNKLTKHNNIYLDVLSYKEKDNYTCAVRVIEAKSYTAASGGDGWWIQHAIWAGGGFMAVLTLLIAVQLIRRARRTENDTDIQAVEVSLTDTYTSLSPANRSSEYSTLFAYSRITSRTERDAHSQAAKASGSTVERKVSDSVYENVECKM